MIAVTLSDNYPCSLATFTISLSATHKFNSVPAISYYLEHVLAEDAQHVGVTAHNLS